MLQCKRMASATYVHLDQVTYGRLVKVKKRYDPTDLFGVNQNIKPAK